MFWVVFEVLGYFASFLVVLLGILGDFGFGYVIGCVFLGVLAFGVLLGVTDVWFWWCFGVRGYSLDDWFG